MFNDLIHESQLVHLPEFITESYAELQFKQSQLMREMASHSLMVKLSPSGGFLTEAAVPAQKQNFIKRFVEYFKKMIAKIKEYLDKKFKLTDDKLNRLQKYLRSIDHGSIEIETYANINSFDTILTLLQKSTEELKDYRINQLQDTFDKMGRVEKTVTVIKAGITKGKSITDKFVGYVPSLSKYNDKDVQKIKEEILGVKKMVNNIQVEKFYPNFMTADKFKGELDKLSAEYGKTLDQLSLATNVSDSLNMLGPNPQHIFTSIVSALTAFFNRNINLIISLVIEIIASTLSTASRMAIIAKGKGMKSKFASEVAATKSDA